MEFKVGDKVEVKDGSYAFGFDGKSMRMSINGIDMFGKTYIVEKVGISAVRDKREHLSGDFTAVCDTLIRHENEWIFTQQRFLRPTTPSIEITCRINGRDVPLKEISEDTLLNIRRRS